MSGHKKPSQVERLLRMLRNAPGRRVSSIELLDPSDGGKPILRGSARILELRERGHVIRTDRADSGVAVWTLIKDVDAPTPAPPAAPEPLFDVGGDR